MDNNLRLRDKVAIVTGAGSSGPGLGNGKAMATLFARHGAKVLLADLHKQRAEETLSIIESEGGSAATIAVDVTEEDGCARMVQKSMDLYGRLDILVNNVGISKRGSVLDVTQEEWDKIMAVNVKSMVLTSQKAIPIMTASGGGSIINIASSAGLRAHRSTPYSTSKAAVIGLTFSMAADHGKDNIRVNAIAPGLVYTPMVAPRMDNEIREYRREVAPLGTEGTGWDVGWAAVYLASDESRWVTGIVLPVDAGLTVTTGITYAPLADQIY